MRRSGVSAPTPGAAVGGSGGGQRWGAAPPPPRTRTTRASAGGGGRRGPIATARLQQRHWPVKEALARPYVRSGPILAEAAWAQLGHHGYGLSGSDWWLVVALHTHAEVWQIAVQYGATAATPSGSIPEQADSGARGPSGVGEISRRNRLA